MDKLVQGFISISCKGLDSKYCHFTGHTVSVTTTECHYNMKAVIKGADMARTQFNFVHKSRL
jgi:hypothetical protein